MKKVYSCALLLSCLSVIANSQSAYAQGFGNYQTAQPLPKVTWPKSRLKVQLIDETPEVTDCRPELTAPKRLNILVPPRAVPALEDIYAVAPGNGGGSGPSGVGAGGGSGHPGIISINTSRPAPARFDSNIPAKGFSRANELPAGDSTNLLAKKALSGRLTPGTPTIIPARSLPGSQRPMARSSDPMVYPDIQGQGTGTSRSDEARSTSSVEGRVFRHGDLLGKPAYEPPAAKGGQLKPKAK